MAIKKVDPLTIVLKPLEWDFLTIQIKGITDLIVHNWAHKMGGFNLSPEELNDPEAPDTTDTITAPQLDTTGFHGPNDGEMKPKQRGPRDPQAEVEAAMYYMPDGKTPGFPSRAFKSASVLAGYRFYGNFPMASTKVYFRVEGEGPEYLVPIIGERIDRVDHVRIGMGSADIRYRPSFRNWSTILHISYLKNMITPNQIVHLVMAAGVLGVGEWRPSAPKGLNGTFGTFDIKQ
jgi:hypothetical protein